MMRPSSDGLGLRPLDNNVVRIQPGDYFGRLVHLKALIDGVGLAAVSQREWGSG